MNNGRIAVCAAVVAAGLSGSVFGAANFGVQVGYNGTWAKGTAFYNNSLPNQGVTESPLIEESPRVYGTYTDEIWGVRSVESQLASTGGGMNVVTFPSQGGNTQQVFSASGSASTNVMGSVGVLKGSATVSAWTTPLTHDYTNAQGQAAHFNSTIGASAEARYSAKWSDMITVSTGPAGAKMRAEIYLDSTLTGEGSSSAAWANTNLSITIVRGGQYFTQPWLTLSDELTLDGDPTSGAQTAFLDMWVLPGDVLYVTQELTGGANAMADYSHASASALSDASHTALFRLYGIPTNPGGPIPQVTATSDSGNDYSNYLVDVSVPEPASLTVLALGAAALMTRRKR